MRSIFSGALWLVAAVAISLGAAGIVTGMAGSGTAAATARGDATVHAHLDTVEGELRTLATDVDALGVQARGALAALVGNDPETAATTLAAGDGLLAEITTSSDAIRSALAAVPLVDTVEGRYLVSDAPWRRIERLHAAVDATAEIETAWASLSEGSVAASRLSTLLADHDAAVLAAAEHGRAARYDDARSALAGADAAIEAARALRDELARSIDVTTLDAWLDRNAAYDVALRGLYDAVAAADGGVDAAVRRAAAAEAEAKSRLPGDSRGLILIMSEIGRGGINSAVIAIEQARGDLAAALAEPSEPGSP